MYLVIRYFTKCYILHTQHTHIKQEYKEEAVVVVMVTYVGENVVRCSLYIYIYIYMNR